MNAWRVRAKPRQQLWEWYDSVSLAVALMGLFGWIYSLIVTGGH